MNQIIYKIRIILLSSLIISFLISCKKDKDIFFSETKVNYVKTDSLLYEQVDIKIDKIDESKNEIVYLISNPKINDLKLVLNLVKEDAIIEINNKKIKTDFNFTYNSSIEDGISLIKILTSKDKNNFFILLPTTTEEFLTFQLLRISNSKESKYYSGFFEINTHKYNDVPNFYKKNYISLKEKKLHYKIEINTFSNKGVLNEIVEEDNNASTKNVLEKKTKFKNSEFKISVLKNLNKNSDFEQEHFKLPIQIYKRIDNNFKLLSENDNLIFDNDNTCVSEGFSDIKTKGNYFTIEGQTCYDYTILVNYYITFKYISNQFFLFKYGEKYFDKENHDNKIPTKIFTSKEFGKIKFEDLTSDFLLELRNK